jgi:uncharacterized membrane protein YqjE
MVGSLRESARTLLSFAETRARLAATEFEEQAIRIAEIAVLAAAALFFVGLALLFLALSVLIALRDWNPLLAASLLATFFLVLAAAAIFTARARMRERPKFLAATLAEIGKDREQMEQPR